MIKYGLGSVPLAWLLANKTLVLGAAPASGPNSKFNGVQIGIIAPYSFRGLPNTAEDILRHLVELGISAVDYRTTRSSTTVRPARVFGAVGRGLTDDQQKALATINESRRQNSPSSVAAVGRGRLDARPIQLAALTDAELALASARAEAIARLQRSPQDSTRSKLPHL
jgi:hypothetical protein